MNKLLLLTLFAISMNSFAGIQLNIGKYTGKVKGAESEICSISIEKDDYRNDDRHPSNRRVKVTTLFSINTFILVHLPIIDAEDPLKVITDTKRLVGNLISPNLDNETIVLYLNKLETGEMVPVKYSYRASRDGVKNDESDVNELCVDLEYTPL